MEQLTEQTGNVSKPCIVMGNSQGRSCRIQELYDTGGEAALLEISRRKPLMKNRNDAQWKEAIVQMATQMPAYGQLRASDELRMNGFPRSPAGARCVRQRYCLEKPGKRLKAPEAMVARAGIVLPEAQLIALERKKVEKEAPGKIVTVSPGYLGSRATYYEVNNQCVGIICQQTYIDRKMVFARLYDRKNALTADDMIHDRVLPFVETHGL